MSSVIPSAESLETDRLLANAQERAKLGNEPTIKEGLVYGLTTGKAIWVAQFGAVGSVLVLWKVLLTHPAGLFTAHPAINSFALALLGLGVSVLQPTKTPGAKKTGFKLHQFFQLSSLGLLGIGSTFAVASKLAHGGKHFRTWHSWFGLAAEGLVVAQIAIGGVLVYAPQLVGGQRIANDLVKHHRAAGYATLGLVFATPVLAMGWSDYMLQNASQLERVLMVGGLGLSFAGILARIHPSKLLGRPPHTTD